MWEVLVIYLSQVLGLFDRISAVLPGVVFLENGRSAALLLRAESKAGVTPIEPVSRAFSVFRRFIPSSV